MNKYVCIASGPSLCRRDIQLAALLKARTISVNNSWQLSAHTDIIFSGDIEWWSTYYSSLDAGYAELWSSHAEAASRFNLHYFPSVGAYNSGLRAIQLAIHLGAEMVFLLGYDCSIKKGLHWHGAHGGGLNNPTENSIYGWKKQFAELHKYQGVLPIINCTRKTELDCFTRMTLTDAVKNYGG